MGFLFWEVGPMWRFREPFETCAVVGLGFGDEGKGMAVAHETERALGEGLRAFNVRFNGGPQAAHNVRVRRGGKVLHLTHAQLGSGSMLGAVTVLDRGMLVSPGALLMVLSHMAALGGAEVWVDSACPVVAPTHAAVNRLAEAARGESCHGSTGWGIGVARAHEEACPECAIRVRDLVDEQSVGEKVALLRDWARDTYGEYAHMGAFPSLAARSEARSLCRSMELARDRFRVRTYDDGWLVRELASDVRNGVVFEGAQGMLLDERFGWFPHVTYGDMTASGARTLAGGPVRVIGVTRSYQTRHGAGPMATDGTFELKGTMVGATDSTSLYVVNSDGDVLDTIKVQNGTFTYTGKADSVALISQKPAANASFEEKELYEERLL